MGWQPHCAAEDFGGVGCVSCNVEEAMCDAPAAAERQGDTVADE